MSGPGIANVYGYLVASGQASAIPEEERGDRRLEVLVMHPWLPDSGLYICMPSCIVVRLLGMHAGLDVPRPAVACDASPALRTWPVYAWTSPACPHGKMPMPPHGDT